MGVRSTARRLSLGARMLSLGARMLAVALAALALALVLAGCGGAGVKATSASGPGAGVEQRQSLAARREFVAHAAAICARAGAQAKPLKAHEEALKGQPVASATPAFVSLARRAMAIALAAYERLRALPRPPADASAVQQLLQAYAEETSDAGDIANAAAHKENSLGEAVSQALGKSVSRNLAAAKRFGMGECFLLE
ncbi:MAG TPA: hypothetical protein VMF09_02830 [Solirubrobacteraceae bacterium]|nr:hypothetical protein [Solirubrobacteraceae bacterium]